MRGILRHVATLDTSVAATCARNHVAWLVNQTVGYGATLADVIVPPTESCHPIFQNIELQPN